MMPNERVEPLRRSAFRGASRSDAVGALLSRRTRRRIEVGCGGVYPGRRSLRSLALGYYQAAPPGLRPTPEDSIVGFALGCILPFAFLCGVCALSRRHRFREYWDFQELKYGVMKYHRALSRTARFRNTSLWSIAPAFYGQLTRVVEWMPDGPSFCTSVIWQ